MFDYLCVLSECESDQILHGLSGVGIDYSWSGWPLGGPETRMESSASKDPLAKSVGLFFLLEPHFHLSSVFPFFFFCSNFATASSSSSTPATASSLAPTQYLIQTNFVATSI